jgi:hypothetical protein
MNDISGSEADKKKAKKRDSSKPNSFPKFFNSKWSPGFPVARICLLSNKQGKLNIEQKTRESQSDC